MYSSLEILDLEGYTIVFTHAAGFRHLAQAGLHTKWPLLVPHAMEVFQNSRDYRDHVWDNAGPDCPFVDAENLAFRVRGVTSLGMDSRDRLLACLTLQRIHYLPYHSDYVLAEVMVEEPGEQAPGTAGEALRHYLLFPAQLMVDHEPGSVVWGAFDRVRDIANLPAEQIRASTHPNLIFRLVLELSRGDRDLWGLMQALGESASRIIGAAELAAEEGYRVFMEDGPPMHFTLWDPTSRQTHADPDSSTGRAGKEVMGIPMDESAYHDLLTILERVMATPGLMGDEELMRQLNQFLVLIMAAAPRRVLARHQGFVDLLPQPEREPDWEKLESWVAEQSSVEQDAAAEQAERMLLRPGEEVGFQVLAGLDRACADQALLRVEGGHQGAVVLEARQIASSQGTGHQLVGLDLVGGREITLQISDLYSVEYLGKAWHR